MPKSLKAIRALIQQTERARSRNARMGRSTRRASLILMDLYKEEDRIKASIEKRAAKKVSDAVLEQMLDRPAFTQEESA